MTQTGLLEHLKLENVSLSQQLTETQHRSIKEKERIALQLQGIEVRAHVPQPGPVGGVLFLVCFFALGFFFWPLVKNKNICTHMYM